MPPQRPLSSGGGVVAVGAPLVCPAEERTMADGLAGVKGVAKGVGADEVMLPLAMPAVMVELLAGAVMD